MNQQLQTVIDRAWDDRDSIGPQTKGEVRQAVDGAIAALDSGEARIAEQVEGEWVVNQWLKKAVLLSFRLNPMELIAGGPGAGHWWDKVPSKFAGTLSHQCPAPGPPAISSIGFKRNDSNTAFFSH